MPNYASNHVTIIGTRDQIDTLIERVIVAGNAEFTAAHLDFERIIPTPPELADTASPPEVVPTEADAEMVNAVYAGTSMAAHTSQHVKAISQAEADRRATVYGTGHRGPILDWYDFHVTRWGTKWGVVGASTYQRVAPDRLNLVFTTAWSQPDGIYAALEGTFGVQVHARAIIEGGFPDETYGDPEDYMADVRSIEFV